ncbi:hypothetical protein CCACVL1_19757 [Corchorus capsularis]|uniref:Uncharacterized protein n=1 Tax=Corchorus capsularis TaxID=210143 RepID=A0A1R3HEY3_COCAP|nr:hypothetical protein CCACVL1_22516 [Corchorus capsularis]OMO68927.1 hypothetical protein CCACVL1_19757 [Corchorus capsularis]
MAFATVFGAHMDNVCKDLKACHPFVIDLFGIRTMLNRIINGIRWE